MKLVKRALKAFYQTVGQIGDKTYCVHNLGQLPVWQTDLPSRSVERLKESILALKPTACEQIHERCLAYVGIPNQCNNRHRVVSILHFYFLVLASHLQLVELLPQLGLFLLQLLFFKLELGFT